MRLLLVIWILALLPISVEGQIGSKKKKNSSAKGTLWGYWGYNRSAYTKSSIHFVGSGYDFTMKGSVAHDNPIPFNFGTYTSEINNTQFNARIGYYFKNNWSISLGIDHMKYVFKDRNEVYLSGYFDPSIDTVTHWAGVFNNEPIITDREKFHYENANGLNYIRAELTRTFKLLELGRSNQFVLSGNAGFSVGTILSLNTFNFAGRKDIATSSMSGYGLSVHFGPRLEFFRHFFIQSNLGAGVMHQVRVRTRPNDPGAYARQVYAYSAFETVIGFLIYLKPRNACDTCPEW